MLYITKYCWQNLTINHPPVVTIFFRWHGFSCLPVMAGANGMWRLPFSAAACACQPLRFALKGAAIAWPRDPTGDTTTAGEHVV